MRVFIAGQTKIVVAATGEASGSHLAAATFKKRIFQAPMMTISADTFKSVLSHLVGAVTIITTRDADGHPWGLTATSFCSLSLDPPLVLFCLATSADSYHAFIQDRYFAVHILSAQQSDLSQRFATKGPAKYQETQFEEGQTGVPLLSDCLAYLECRIQTIYPGGDHVIIVGLVEHACQNQQTSNAQPLLYYTRQYGTFTHFNEEK